MAGPRTFLIVVLIAASLIVTAQSAEDPFMQPGQLSLRIKSMNFIKDNEYKSPLIEGYTLLGLFLQPELIYAPSSKVTLQAGAHFLMYYGTGTFSKIRPVISTSVRLSDKTLLTMGTLRGSDSHNMFDPHFSSERFYNNYNEEGFQLTHRGTTIFSDTWLDWDNFIFKGDSTRESFTFGESFRYRSPNINDRMHIEVPLQGMIKHYGGEISDYPEPVRSFVNSSAGIGLYFDPGDDRTSKFDVEYIFFHNEVINHPHGSERSTGFASWARATYSYRAFNFSVGYWQAHDYYAPNGNPVFTSIADYNPLQDKYNRRLVTNNFNVSLMPENDLHLFVGIETYYDVDLKTMDYSLILHLNFDKLIRLAGQRN